MDNNLTAHQDITLASSIECLLKTANTQSCLTDELRESMRLVANKAQYNPNDHDEVKALKELLHHAWIHAAYRDLGSGKMTTRQLNLYEALKSEWSLEGK